MIFFPFVGKEMEMKFSAHFKFCTTYNAQRKKCIAGKKNKKLNFPIYFNINCRTEMKLMPIIMDYCLLQLEALKFFLGVRLHGGGVST